MLTDWLLLTGKIQEVILQEQLEKEDEVLVSLAGLKQVPSEHTHKTLTLSLSAIMSPLNLRNQDRSIINISNINIRYYIKIK